MVSVAQVQRGAQRFVENDLIPKVPGWQGVIMGAAAGIALSKAGDMIKSLGDIPIVKMLGVIDENDGIDIDILRDEFIKQVRRVGSIKIDLSPLSIVSLGEADINRLYEYITTS